MAFAVGGSSGKRLSSWGWSTGPVVRDEHFNVQEDEGARARRGRLRFPWVKMTQDQRRIRRRHLGRSRRCQVQPPDGA
ncbi:hypothetical protein GCM10028787_09380 [Brachybacterium horti]